MISTDITLSSSHVPAKRASRVPRLMSHVPCPTSPPSAPPASHVSCPASRPSAPPASHVPCPASHVPAKRASRVPCLMSRVPAKRASHVPCLMSHVKTKHHHSTHQKRRHPMTEIISAYGGFRKTLSFGFVCLIYHATEVFCTRNYSYKNDALGKTVGQMVGAARSARQNIIEGSVRAGTSKETELRLYDVAKGSLEELAGDYEAFLIGHGEVPWAENSPEATKLMSISLDHYQGTPSRNDYGKYIMAMRVRFAEFLEAEDPIVAANSVLMAIDKACRLLHRQMETIAEEFCTEGGFTERMSNARLEMRGAQMFANHVPLCPKCGKPMRKLIARKGSNAGNPFWSCTGYPNCNGTLKYT